MGKPITIVNKMAESVLTQEPQNASSLTQAPYPSFVAGQICNWLQKQSAGSVLQTAVVPPVSPDYCRSQAQ